MRRAARLAVGTGILLCLGCAGSTASWIDQLKAPEANTRLHALRILQQRKGDAAQIVPALIGSLKDEDTTIRRDAAWTLGSFGAEAQGAVPALQTALRDREPSVRKSARQALMTIDPAAAGKAGVK